ncbi:MAG: PEGA domain-containing protein [Sphingomonadaceae bacterium]
MGAALAVALILPACATVTRGTQQKFEIKSEPSGADVKLSTGMACTTPCRLKLRRKEEFVATISKEGYESASVQVESKMHGGGGAALAGNILAGGLIGGVLDGTNGSLRDLTPNPIEVTLKPIAVVAAPAPVAIEAAVAQPAVTEPAAETPTADTAAPAPTGAPN